ncbi:MAG: hypothetical protein WD740_00850 [Anaerolineales bacterium]
MAENRTLQPTPRWLYAILNWVKRTPGRGWLLAAIIFGAGILLIHWPLWLAGVRTPYEIDPALIFPASWFPLGLVFWLWMDGVAQTTITDFCSGLGKTSKETQHLYISFISLGERLALILVLGGLFLGFGYQVQQTSTLGITDPVQLFLGSLVPGLGSVMELLAVARVIKQLFTVNSLYKEIKRINLFNLWPVYALSRYGYILALAFILITVAIDLVVRLDGGAGLALENIFYTLALSLVVFLAPMLGINARLRREKQTDLQRMGSEINAIYMETEAAIRSRKLARVPALKTAASALREQMDTVQKVATWPWNPGSLRNLLIPVLLPLFIAILQRYLVTFLGI